MTANDWKVFGYLVGRGALWVSVVLAVWSMYDYFKYFYLENKKKKTAASIEKAVFPKSDAADLIK